MGKATDQTTNMEFLEPFLGAQGKGPPLMTVDLWHPK